MEYEVWTDKAVGEGGGMMDGVRPPRGGLRGYYLAEKRGKIVF